VEEKDVNKRKTGAAYEALAAQYLEENGARIIERNFRNRFGEIDLVALDGAALVFTEVKYRSNNHSGKPEEAVTLPKQRTICLVSDYYCLIRQIPDNVPRRYDVAAFEGTRLRYIRDAFPYRPR